MATQSTGVLADSGLPPDVLAEMERLNDEAAIHHIWLRTRANAPQKAPWFDPGSAVADGPPPPAGRAVPHLWRWRDIEPYLHRIAALAPLEFTERQQFLLTNPGFGGALRAVGAMRAAISIYKPGDVAITHIHTPNASRTILSEEGGYSTIEGEQCQARRGDLILTPHGTWHGHGNSSSAPVIWLDVLDWPLLEYLDCVWSADDTPARAANRPAPTPDHSARLYGAGGLKPLFVPAHRGIRAEATPMLHFSGADVRAALEGLVAEDGSPHDGIIMEFTNPVTGVPAFPTLSYRAQLLRPGEETLDYRHTASTLYTVLAGSGHTEVAGRRLEWEPFDIFAIPNHLWRRHVNRDSAAPAILYSVTDAPLLQKIGQYGEQGRTSDGRVVELGGGG